MLVAPQRYSPIDWEPSGDFGFAAPARSPLPFQNRKLANAKPLVVRAGSLAQCIVAPRIPDSALQQGGAHASLNLHLK